jgi:hypothetical protein
VVRAVEVLLLSEGHLVINYGWSRDRVNGGLPTSWSIVYFRTPQCGALRSSSLLQSSNYCCTQGKLCPILGAVEVCSQNNLPST